MVWQHVGSIVSTWRTERTILGLIGAAAALFGVLISFLYLHWFALHAPFLVNSRVFPWPIKGSRINLIWSVQGTSFLYDFLIAKTE